MARKKLGEILIEAGLATEAIIAAGLDEQRRWGGPLGRVMVDRGLLAEDALVKALSTQLRMPTVDVRTLQVPREVLDLVPAELALAHNVLPVKLDGKSLDVAMGDPTNLAIIDELQIRAQLDVMPLIAGPRAIDTAIRRLYIEARRATSASMAAVRDTAAIAAGRMTGPRATAPGAAVPSANGADEREREMRALQRRVQILEGLLQRDEDVIRQLCLLLIEKNLVSRDEVQQRLQR